MDFANFEHFAVVVTAILSVATAVIVGLRGKAQKTISSEWQNLATAKAERITDLETRVRHLEEQLRAVHAENAEYRRLNLEYQAEVLDLRRKVANLELERMGRVSGRV